ncbi:MAG: adenosine deaminase [Myxococcales bacterium]|nr:adenosine deaminase [Myxococcales bacterium]
MELTRAQIEQLPKTDLHVHLDGSQRVETILELADEEGIALPAHDAEGLRQALRCGEATGSLERYLEAFEITLQAMQSERALHRIAYELVEDAAAENVRYLEVRYAPMLHTRGGLRLTAVVEAVLAGLWEAQTDLGVTANVILCGIRNISPRSSFEMAQLAVAYKGRGVVAFDLAGAEYDHPARKHLRAFNLVRANNISVTIHAGEAYGPASIHDAIHVCGAHRIGHGCRLREDGDLLHYVNDHRIPLECCPSSNVQTGAVPDLASHPLKLYHDLGLRVTINTDNRLITDTTCSRELWLCHTEMGFEWDDLRRVIVNGFKAAFLPFHQKQAVVRSITRELDAFEAELAGAPAPEDAPAEPRRRRHGEA